MLPPRQPLCKGFNAIYRLYTTVRTVYSDNSYLSLYVATPRQALQCQGTLNTPLALCHFIFPHIITTVQTED